MGIAIPRDEEDTARGTAATREESAAKIRAMGMYISDGTLAPGTLGNLISVREMLGNIWVALQVLITVEEIVARLRAVP